MYTSGTLYPMLGVGSFMASFWTGIVLAYELGVGCMTMLILGLLCACLGTIGVCELQRRDGHGMSESRPARATRRGDERRPEGPRPSRLNARPVPVRPTA